MRVGIRNEVERRERCNTRLDPHLFEADGHEKGPNDVSELRGCKQRRQRHTRGGTLRGEGQGKMADEHRREF